MLAFLEEIDGVRYYRFPWQEDRCGCIRKARAMHRRNADGGAGGYVGTGYSLLDPEGRRRPIMHPYRDGAGGSGRTFEPFYFVAVNKYRAFIGPELFRWLKGAADVEYQRELAVKRAVAESRPRRKLRMPEPDGPKERKRRSDKMSEEEKRAKGRARMHRHLTRKKVLALLRQYPSSLWPLVALLHKRADLLDIYADKKILNI